MFERAELILRIVCIGLATLLLYDLSRLALRGDPLARLKIPAVPSLAGTTNAPIGAKGTNSMVDPRRGKAQTNSAPSLETGKTALATAPRPVPANQGTNAGPSPESARAQTNSIAIQEPDKTRTNSVTSLETGKTAIVPAPRLEPKPGPPPGRQGPTSVPSPAMARMGPGSGPGTAPDVSPAIRARVDRITQSEIFGPVPKPKIVPLALLGIAGNDAFLRVPSGETGLLKEGQELAGVKLLRIGTNRVLVEHEGEKKELTIFSGFGGETLLPKGKEKPQ